MPPPRHVRRGLAIPQEELGSEVNLLAEFHPDIPFVMGPQNDECEGCGAFRWKRERRKRDAGLRVATFSNCCQQGAVELPVKYFPTDVGAQIPEFYRAVLTGSGNDAKEFRINIQKYNNALSFTSLGANIDRTVAGGRGPYVFRISGQLSHVIGSLLPLPGDQPGFAQIFMYGGTAEEEVDLRINRSRADLDPRLLMQFQQFMNDNNPYARVFRSASERCNNNEHVSLRIRTIDAPGTDHRRYNRPTVDEVAAIIEGDGEIGAAQRDIVLERRSGAKQRISELHTGYFALRYPLLFLYGSQMWTESFSNPTEANPRDRVSSLKWFAYLLFQRAEFLVILASGRLFQEFVVDMYVCVEHFRLQYFRYNQTEIRAEVYQGVVEAMDNEAADDVVGRRIILPSSFIGGPRHLQQLYQDAMSLVAEYGNPSLFITMTANPEWQEIIDALDPEQTPSDRPDLVARAFHIRFHSLLDDVTRKHRLGRCLAWVYTIEFQKRGLPHGHLILFLHADDRPTTSEHIDCLITAQLPDPDNEPRLFNLFTKFLLHGPCQNYKCWTGDRCRLGYPRSFRDTTEIAENSYPNYKRPNNGRHFYKGQTRYDNGHVVPTNRFLLLKYECHINVEIAISIRAIKYLFKYILKGHDRTIAGLEDERGLDEISSFLNARFLTAPEAIWRLLQFECAGRFPPVQRLSLHLENSQTIYFLDAAGLRRAVESGRAERTTLTEFFRLCHENAPLRGTDRSIRTIKYNEVSKYFVWNQRDKKLTPRQNGAISIGRVYFANMKRGDLYYLRLLLFHVPGPTSFSALRTVDGICYSTFREAADKLGLLLDDQHYHETLTEAAIWKTGRQLRHLFAIILCHSSPSNPRQLWDDHADDLSDDCEHQITLVHPHMRPTREQIRNYGLYLLEKVLHEMESNLRAVGLDSVDDVLMEELDLGPDVNIEQGVGVDPEESLRKYNTMFATLTNEQRTVVTAIFDAISADRPHLSFLDGPGGTGKTFVLNTILHYCNSHDIPFQSVSAAGISSLLLVHGKTAHNAFKIPIPVFEDSTCPISASESLGQHLKLVRFIVWDEVAMQHRHAIEAVDRTLRHLTDLDLPFGGKVVLFAGDFRQTLPVVRGGTLFEQAAATLKSSPFWNSVTRFSLSRNIRLGGTNTGTDPANITFARWLLELGSGRLQEEFSTFISIMHVNVSIVSAAEMCDPSLIRAEYSGVNELISNQNWTELTDLYSNRCLITPLNETVQLINSVVMDSLPGNTHTSISLDSMDEAFVDPVTPDILNTFNFSGFPSHILDLKVGASVMLLRNLNLADGLCNGTRLLITNYAPHTLQCRILTGEMRGKVISLPKIKLHHNGNEDCPIPFYRYQFPITSAFCMTINKSQGQSLKKVSILLPKPVFAHGQLYVALSRCTSASNVQVYLTSDSNLPTTRNIVFHPILHD